MAGPFFELGRPGRRCKLFVVDKKMENISILIPLVKDLLSGIYNNVSDIHGKKTLQTIPTLTFFLEQVAQGDDKVKSTFKLTVGPNTVLTGDEPPSKPVPANLNISSTCCDSTLEGTFSPILGPKKHPKISNTVDEPLAKPVQAANVNISSTCCESSMEGAETDSPILGQQHPNISKLVEPNLLFSSPTLPTQEPGQEISAIFRDKFRQEDNIFQPSSDSITKAISSPPFSGLFSQFSLYLFSDKNS